VLKELEADGKPRLRVKNKIDLLPVAEREAVRNHEGIVYVSAAKGMGIDVLLARIDELLEQDRPSRVRLKIPQTEGKLLAFLEAKAVVLSRKYREGTVQLEVEAPESVLRRVKQFVK
jgi:GTP-binding protein HflX